jgi:hypothetical protein
VFPPKLAWDGSLPIATGIKAIHIRNAIIGQKAHTPPTEVPFLEQTPRPVGLKGGSHCLPSGLTNCRPDEVPFAWVRKNEDYDD